MFERLNSPQEALNWQLGAALTMEREIRLSCHGCR